MGGIELISGIKIYITEEKLHWQNMVQVCLKINQLVRLLWDHGDIYVKWGKVSENKCENTNENFNHICTFT